MDLGLHLGPHGSSPLNGPRKSPLDFVNFRAPIIPFRAELVILVALGFLLPLGFLASLEFLAKTGKIQIRKVSISQNRKDFK